jgi:hypothetical protein
MVEYLTEKTETNKQLGELTLKKSGMSGCMGDIGTHAAQLAEYISFEITQLCADINIVKVETDDDGNVLLKFTMVPMVL